MVHSAGRGGIGNLYVGDSIEKGILEVEEKDGANHPHATHVHGYESTGRGGAGNLADRSRSREPKDKNGKEPGHGHGLTGLLHRTTTTTPA